MATLKIHERFILFNKNQYNNQISVDTKRKRFLKSTKHKLKKLIQNSRIGLWSTQLYKIQCHFGNTIESYFTFHRHLTVLNLLIGLAVYLAALIPQLTENDDHQDYHSFYNRNNRTETLISLAPENLNYADISHNSKSELVSHCLSVANEPYYKLNETVAMNIIDTISATGYTLRFPILFSWFKSSESDDNVLLPYMITAFSVYFIAFIYIIYQLGRVTLKPIDSKHRFSGPISEYTFTAYDFSLSKNSAIVLKKQQIKNVLSGLQSERDIENLKLELRSKFYQYSWANLLNLRRIIGNLLSLILLVGLIFLVSFSIYFQANYDNFFSINAVQKIKSSFILELVIQFLPQIVMGISSVTAKILLVLITGIEVRRGGSKLRISLLRVMILQYFLFSVFIGTNLLIASCWARSKFLGFGDINDYNLDGCESCRGMSNCWENRLGQELFKYVTFTFLVQSGMVWLLHLPRKYLKFLPQSEFDYFGHLIKLNEIQTAVFCGLFFSPILALLQGLLSVLSFYQFYIGAIYFQKASIDSNKGIVKNKQFAFNVLKYGWFIGWVFFVIAIAFLRPSKYCGGFFWEISKITSNRSFHLWDQIFHYLPNGFVSIVGKTAHAFGISAVLLVFLWWVSKLEETRIMETRILLEKINLKKEV